MARYSVRLVLKLGHLIVEFGTPDSGYMERVFKGKVPYNRKIISEFFGFMEFPPKKHVPCIRNRVYILRIVRDWDNESKNVYESS